MELQEIQRKWNEVSADRIQLRHGLRHKLTTGQEVSMLWGEIRVEDDKVAIYPNGFKHPVKVRWEFPASDIESISF